MGPRSRPLGRRRRRLYWTVAILALVAVLGTAAGWAVYRSSRTELYRPGEATDAITSRLDLGIPEDAPDPVFVDVTEEAGLSAFRSFSGVRTSQLPEDMGPGAAWGDYDGDGDDDLFLVSQGGPIGSPASARERSRLYRNLGDGTFSEVDRFPDTRILGMGAAWGDYDGDGDLDLVVTGYDVLRLFRNDDGTFEREATFEDRKGYWAGPSWSDFDRDGDLDLYVCGYVRYVEDPGGVGRVSQQYGRAVPYTLNPASFEPERNLLFRNLGGGRFEEVGERLGVANPQGRSLAGLWHDLDDDGRPDLYVANDISDNALFLNRGDLFEDASHAAWVADYRGAMGLAAGDWNRDGDDDLFVTHWIAQENALYDSMLEDFREEGKNGLHFMDVADQRGVGQIALQMVGWGTQFVDFDSDGWLDLVVANGSTFERDDDPTRLRPQRSFLFWNRHGESFHELSSLVEAFAVPRVSRGLAVADYDDDGDDDLLFVDRDGGARLLRNDTPQGNRVFLRLAGSPGNPVVGARVVARIGSVSLRRTPGGTSYLSQSSQTLHLGLGEAQRIDSLEVRWPDGSTQELGAIEANAVYELTVGGDAPRRIASWIAPEPTAVLTRDQLAEFWRLQRAAMHAMKVEGDPEGAIALFEQALELNPTHFDSLYYLGNCLAETGRVEEALETFAALIDADPLSHRGHKRWGTLRAVAARDADDLDEAAAALERASEINPEETGASLVLGEVELMRGNASAARQRLEWVVGSNPHSGEAFFVLAYLDWREGDRAGATERLRQAADTRGEGWKPVGSVAEGEVRRKMHVEAAPFEDYYEAWDGRIDLDEAFEPLDERLRGS